MVTLDFNALFMAIDTILDIWYCFAKQPEVKPRLVAKKLKNQNSLVIYSGLINPALWASTGIYSIPTETLAEEEEFLENKKL